MNDMLTQNIQNTQICLSLNIKQIELQLTDINVRISFLSDVNVSKI